MIKIYKIETCITNAKEATETKYGQEVHQYKAELEVYKRRIEGMKDEIVCLFVVYLDKIRNYKITHTVTCN